METPRLRILQIMGFEGAILATERPFGNPEAQWDEERRVGWDG